MILALVLTLSVGDVQVGEVLLRGPLEHATFEVAGRYRTEIDYSLRAGEQRTLTLPFGVSKLSRSLAPELVECSPPEGEAIFASWVETDDEWASLPPGLRSRTRPPIESRSPQVSIGGLLLLIATGVFVVGVRRAPLLSLGIGLLGAIVVLVHPVRLCSDSYKESVRVLEGETTGEWVVVDGHWGLLEVSPDSLLQVETVPADASVDWIVSGITPRLWALFSNGRPLYSISKLDPGQRSFDRNLNTWGRLEEVWVRDTEGTWTARGAWELGAALPPEDPNADAPPSWLASGLPQARSVLLARIEEGFRGDSIGQIGQTPVWIRLTGF